MNWGKFRPPPLPLSTVLTLHINLFMITVLVPQIDMCPPPRVNGFMTHHESWSGYQFIAFGLTLIPPKLKILNHLPYRKCLFTRKVCPNKSKLWYVNEPYNVWLVPTEKEDHYLAAGSESSATKGLLSTRHDAVLRHILIATNNYASSPEKLLYAMLFPHPPPALINIYNLDGIATMLGCSS